MSYILKMMKDEPRYLTGAILDYEEGKTQKEDFIWTVKSILKRLDYAIKQIEGGKE